MGSNHSVVLMYHAVIRDKYQIPPDREDGAELYDLAVEAFADHLRQIKAEGISVIKAEDLKKEEGVIITFDDGEMNNYTEAFPLLKQFGFPGYFFITADRIGKSGYMDWPQLKELCQAGMVIGSHGLTHRVLTSLNPSELHQELFESKRILEAHLGQMVDSFSVPRGFVSLLVAEQARQAGYRHIFISGSGPKNWGNLIARTAVKSNWTQQRFSLALIGKVPLQEQIFEGVKAASKRFLGQAGYNSLRSKLLGK